MLDAAIEPRTLSTAARFAAGTGRLRVARVGGASAALTAGAATPSKLFVTRPRGAAVWAFATTIGGGLLAGDATALEVDVGSGAACFLGTQASTKVHRSPDGRESRQTLAARVAGGALLAVVSDPVTCYAGARHVQRASFLLDDGASLLLVDGLTAGRAARGERWAFASHASRTEIRLGGRPLLVDALRLDGPPGTIGARMGRFDALATAILVGPRTRAVAAAALEKVAAMKIRPGAELYASASALGAAVVVRIAAERHAAAAGLVKELLAPIASELGEGPWDRRA